MTAIVVDGDAARCVQMDPGERVERNGRPGLLGLVVVDHWTMTATPSTEGPGDTTYLSVARMGDEDVEGFRYVVVITEQDAAVAAQVEAAGLDLGLAIDVLAVTTLTHTRTDEGARRVALGLARAVAQGVLPVRPDGEYGAALLRVTAHTMAHLVGAR